jgi:hypothetical protein
LNSAFERRDQTAVSRDVERLLIARCAPEPRRGTTPPSLYGTFGDKKWLFLEAVDRYQAGPGAFAQRA